MVSFLAAMRNEDAAQQYIEAVFPDDRVFVGVEMPLHKWLQVAYLSDAGRLVIRAAHLAQILGISTEAAIVITERLQQSLTVLASLRAETSLPPTSCMPA